MNNNIYGKGLHCTNYKYGIPGNNMSKILLTMKLTIVFTLFACLQIKASVFSQRVSLSVKDASLEKVIKEIRKQTGYAFFYDAAYLEKATPVSVNVSKVSVEEALEKTFAGQQFTWEVLEKTILIKPARARKSTVSNELTQPANEVRGRITNDEGEPLVGASIRIKGSLEGTLTDANGTFYLKDVSPQTILIISYTGYGTQEIPVGETGQIALVLHEDLQALDELVVIGYGTQTRRDLTGAISSVKSDDLVMSQGPEIGNMLKGTVAGLTIQQNSAQPGGALDILIRGAGSVNAS